MEAIEMIDQLDANHKVGRIWIGLIDGNEWNEEILTRMI